ncbi:8746_t:CDS:10 [Racocetra persica]|uniref:8746_t:CDS:1 n=1 Tax=Racocetra persica TaxID=160502 RepID=A0ACA9L6F6_9GLOM|nr:8746_t:CDS:10 [Racocetra persica]
MGQPVRALKKTLRKEMSSLLNQIPPEKIEEESAIVAEKVMSSQQYQSSTYISVYLSMPKAEISTKSIVYDIFNKGKICYVPRWDGENMEMVKLESLDDYLSLKLNKWGIQEPDHDQIRDTGLAFDLNRNRLGHGKGYYDKYVTKCRQWTKPPLAMALALDSQILKDKDIPVTNTDQKPDFIISPYQDIGPPRRNNWREEMRRVLDPIPFDQIMRESGIVTERVISLQEYKDSEHICIYPRKKCYVPCWSGNINERMEIVRLNSWQNSPHPPDNFDDVGYLKPDNQQRNNATKLNLIIIPGIAYDLDGNRLGYSKDPYNDFLEKCRTWTNPPKINIQILKDEVLPVTGVDQKPDLVLSPNYNFRGRD